MGHIEKQALHLKLRLGRISLTRSLLLLPQHLGHLSVRCPNKQFSPPGLLQGFFHVSHLCNTRACISIADRPQAPPRTRQHIVSYTFGW